jgi:hypothetical protein
MSLAVMRASWARTSCGSGAGVATGNGDLILVARAGNLADAAAGIQ